MEEHLECLVCERWLFTFGVGGDLHHVLGGYKGLRKDDPRNSAMLCFDCHHEYHNGFQLSRANVLYFKELNDPLCSDWEWLAALYKGNGNAKLEKPEKPSWITPPWIH